MKNFEFTIRPAALEDAEKIYDLLNEVGSRKYVFSARTRRKNSGADQRAGSPANP